MSTSPKLPITVIIPVRNEAANLPKCLDSLKMMEKVILIDSGSDDLTDQIAADYGVEVVQFHYSGLYPKKRQWALDNLTFDTPWVLLLDADEEMTPKLADEIHSQIEASNPASAYMITKGFHFMGKKFRHGGFSHSAVLLIRPQHCRFERFDLKETSGMDMEVHERVLVDGPIGTLINPLVHNDFKGLQAYIDRHNRYSSWEAAVRNKLLNDDDGELKPSFFGNTQQRRRWLKKIAMRIPMEPWLWFLYHYIFRLGFLEGQRGLIASRIRKQYIENVRAKMFENSIW